MLEHFRSQLKSNSQTMVYQCELDQQSSKLERILEVA